MKKACFTALLLVIFCVSFLTPEISAQTKSKIVLKKYPEFKIGALAINFNKPLPMPNKDNVKKVMDWASDSGFAWVEIRDPRGALSYNECKELAAYAVSKKLEVIYALNVGILDPQYTEIFYRGCANAALFTGPRIIRTAAPGPEFDADVKKNYWTKEEFDKLIGILNNAANVAKSFGLQLVIENATDALQGDGVNTFGTIDVQTKSNSNVGFQLDTSNFWTAGRTHPDPKAVKEAIDKFAGKTFYAHLKTATKDFKVADYLGDNLVGFGEILDSLAKAKNCYYLGIELPQQEKFATEAENMEKSVKYLKSKF